MFVLLWCFYPFYCEGTVKTKYIVISVFNYNDICSCYSLTFDRRIILSVKNFPQLIFPTKSSKPLYENDSKTPVFPKYLSIEENIK
jgi:hypothetical protein